MTEHTKDGAGTSEDGGKDKVVFTPEQQSKVQDLIDAAYRKAFAKASEAKASKEVETLQSEVERLRPLAEGAEDIEKERAALASERKQLSIRLALSRHSVIDPDAAVRLINENVGWRDGKPVVYNDDGELALDESGLEMTLDSYVGEFLEEKSYLVKATPNMGAGSRGGPSLVMSGSGAGMKRADFDLLSPREKSRYIKDGMKIADD